MVVTIAWMKKSFEQFNKDYFRNTLPTPAFSLSRGHYRQGCFCYKTVMKNGVMERRDYKISISTFYEMSERQACNILLHEMIHYYILYHGLKDDQPHGRVFHFMADALNNKFGWNITTTLAMASAGYKVSEETKRRCAHKLSFYVLAMETVKEGYVLSVVSPSCVNQINKLLKKASEIRHHAWYNSRDPFFLDFPKARKRLTGRRVSQEIFLEKIKAAQPLSL